MIVLVFFVLNFKPLRTNDKTTESKLQGISYSSILPAILILVNQPLALFNFTLAVNESVLQRWSATLYDWLSALKTDNQQ